MQHLVFFAFVAMVAAVFALLEIQIEGDAGWAAKLPTWRVDSPWARRLLGGRPLTGYHFYCQLFLLLTVHVPYGLGLVTPSLPHEARILSFLILFWILEDFLWFVFNPRYGAAGFTREKATWHAAAWWWIMPREYWIFTPIALALYVASL